MNVPDVLSARVMRGQAKDLVVRPLLIAHPEHADDPRGDQATRECRLFKQHQGVQWVAISAEGVLDEPVVGRVPGRGKQHAVKPDPASVVIDLVLVPLALGDLDDYFHVHAFSLSPMPWLLIYSIVAGHRTAPGGRVPPCGNGVAQGGVGLSYAHPNLDEVS